MPEHRALGGARLWRLLAVALLLTPPQFYAATITVDGTTCNLIDAIDAANSDSAVGGCAAGSGADTLDLGASVSLSAVNVNYSGPTGLPVVSSDITVNGGGFTIERAVAAPDFRIFAVSSTGTLTLDDVTVSNGSVGGGAAGAGIFPSSGVLIVTGSTLSGNVTNGEGGAIGTRTPGGATITVNNSTIAGNSARYSGAIYTNPGSVLSVSNSTVSGNYGGFGGISAGVSDVTISGTTISGNYATFAGGGLYVWGDGPTTVTNSTFSGNSAFDYGGGIFSSFANQTTVKNTTLSGNEAGAAGGGISVYYNGSLLLENSIVANSPSGGNCDGPVVDGGNNFDDDGSCPGAAPIVAGVDFDTALADNGGPTLTHALLDGSVAQNMAGVCGLTTDQRGVPRNDGACDSGSFELLSEGACCTDGPVLESECIVVTQDECDQAGPQGGLFLGPGTNCDEVIDCVALAVTMDTMSAEATPEGVLVGWTTAMELDTVAFQVLRESPFGRAKSLVEIGRPIPATGSQLAGSSYELLDDSRPARAAMIYYIDDIDIYGKVTRHGPIVVERGSRSAPRSREVTRQR